MKYVPRFLMLLLVAIFVIAPYTANAVLISGTGGTGTDPNLADGTLIDFESTAAGQYASLTIFDVTFSDPGGDVLDVDGDFAGLFNTRGSQSMSNDFDYVPDQFRFDFASPVTAFGFNWGASDNDWRMDVYGTDGLLESHIIPKVYSSNAGDYFGAVVNGISYVILTDLKDSISNGDYVFVDDFRYVGDIEVSIDIKFCSDPNAFNCKKRGVLPVTIFGTEDFLVEDINPSTLMLCTADLSFCTGEPRDYSYADRGDPTTDLGAAMCAINPDTGEEEDFLKQDDFLDLDAAFEASEVKTILGDFCDDAAKGDVSEALIIIGETYDGVPIYSEPQPFSGIDRLVKVNK